MSQEKGYDRAKKIKGHKRHNMVNTQGFLLIATVSSANENDRQVLANLLEQPLENKLKLKNSR